MAKAYLRVFRWKSKTPDPNQRAVVYKMICPVRDIDVYIGYTINFEKRVYAHLHGCGARSKKARFIKLMQSYGFTPRFEIIKIFDSIPEAKSFEKEMIIKLNPSLNTK